jgi:glycosyltransferase involved in cell wall biosynthesis
MQVIVDLSVIVLTLNEERNIGACLASVRDLATQLFVVDSGSTDRTVEIARSLGCIVECHTFESHAKQWKWALTNLPLTTPWVLAIDADQIVTETLRASIISLLHSDRGGNIAGVYIARRQVFRGKWIRFGGYYPKTLLKLFRREFVIIDESDLVDHHFDVNGRTTIIAGDLVEANQNENEIFAWIAKHNAYAVRQAREEVERGAVVEGRWLGASNERTRRVKSMWRHMPLYVRPVLYFGYRYILRRGFLDGKQGFVFHVLQAFWYRLLVDINIDELKGGSGSLRVPAERTHGTCGNDTS